MLDQSSEFGNIQGNLFVVMLFSRILQFLREFMFTTIALFVGLDHVSGH